MSEKKKKTTSGRKAQPTGRFLLGPDHDIDATDLVGRPVMLRLVGADGPFFGILKRTELGGAYIALWEDDRNPDDLLAFSRSSVLYLGVLPLSKFDAMRAAASGMAMETGIVQAMSGDAN
jgi:hypothetical protein